MKIQEVSDRTYVDDTILFNSGDLLPGHYRTAVIDPYIAGTIGPKMEQARYLRLQQSKKREYDQEVKKYPKKMIFWHNAQQQLLLKQQRNLTKSDKFLDNWIKNGNLRALGSALRTNIPGQRKLIKLIVEAYGKILIFRTARREAEAFCADLVKVATYKGNNSAEEVHCIELFRKFGWVNVSDRQRVVDRIRNTIRNASRLTPLPQPSAPRFNPPPLPRLAPPEYVDLPLVVQAAMWTGSPDGIEKRPRQRELTYLLETYNAFSSILKSRGNRYREDPRGGYGKLSPYLSLTRATMDWYLYHKDANGAKFLVPHPLWIPAIEWQQSRAEYDRWFARPYLPTTSEFELTEQLRNEFVQAGFCAWHSLPTLVITEELVKPRSYFDGMITPDYCGKYFSRARKIVLYDRVLWMAAESLDAKVEDCRLLVFVHEMAHWITHDMPHWAIDSWPLRKFDATDTYVLEGLAELMTYWCVSKSDVLRTLFLKWHARLPKTSPYRAWEQFQHHEHDKVIRAIVEMRKLRRPATLKDLIDFCGES